MPSPADELDLTPCDGGIVLRAKVVPGASRSRVMGVWNRCLRIAVAAPPEDGKANREVAALIANVLGVRAKAVEIVSGSTSPQKTLRIAGVTAAAARKLLLPD